MPDINFKVDDKTYCAHLSKGYIIGEGRDKHYCQCILTAINPIRIFSGVALKNPNDNMKFDESQGYHIAFKRAIFQMYLVHQIIKDISVTRGGLHNGVIKDWTAFWQKYRVPFGKALHNYYEDDTNFPF